MEKFSSINESNENIDDFVDIIKKYNLEPYLKIIITKNNGNYNDYHNIYHIITVVKNTYLIAIDEKISDTDIRLLLIAAMFHDFDHSGGKIKDDAENIKSAIDAFYKYTKESDINNDFVVNIIKCTQFPYKEDEILTKYQKIIRDADMLQWVEDNFIQQILLGLSKEYGGIISVNSLENQIKFMKNTKFFTNFARQKSKNNIYSKIRDCEFLIGVLKLS
jgi:HD superfamily phosphodiesterase